MTHPDYLASIDRERNRVFVLAMPELCAIRIDGVWQRCTPLLDEEVKHYELVMDFDEAQRLVEEARRALDHIPHMYNDSAKSFGM